jgi:hypothetical protein
MVAALFWGNCFSCPQLLLSVAKDDVHGCCKRSAPAAQKCTNNVLKHFVKADPVPAQALEILPVQLAMADAAPAKSEFVAAIFPETAPNLLELTSLLRI